MCQVCRPISLAKICGNDRFWINFQDENFGGVATKKILKFLLFICLAAITLTACGGDETPSTGTAATATGRVPDTNQTTSYTSTFGEDHDYTIKPPSYTDNGNGTITDSVTGLVWQKQDDATARTWNNAITYCNTLTLAGQTGWRLPSRIELISIIDYGVYNPSINTTYFPSTISSNYWSSTAYAYGTSYAWNVDFYGGGTGTYYNKTNSYYMRCVR